MSDTWINADRLPSSAILGGREIICDGINANRMNDGFAAHARIWGVRAPTAAQLAAVTAAEATGSSGAGVTIGAHLIAVTFAVTVGGVILAESAPIQLPAVSVTAAANKINLAVLPLSDNPAVNARVIYMSAAGGDTLYRVSAEATLADNTTTTYAIDVTDALLTATQLSDTNELLPASPYARENNNQLALGGEVPYTTGTAAATNGGTMVTFTGAAITRAFEGKQIELDTDGLAYTIDTVNETAQTATLTSAYQGVTGSGKTIRVTADGSTVYFSNPLPSNIEGFGPLAAGGELLVGGDDGDEITGIGVCRGNWVVGKKQHLYLLAEAAGGGWQQTKVSNEIGVASHNTMVQDDHGNAIWYAGGAGVYIMSTNQPLCMSRLLTPLFQTGINHERDGMAHAVWYAARKWYILWVTRAGENNLTDLCLIADLSQGVENAVWLGPALEQVRWWPQRLPAVNSKTMLFPDGQQRVLVMGYSGNVWLFDVGEVDGVSGMSCRGVVSAVGADYLECAGAWFQDDAGGTNCQGAVVTMLSGAAAGQRRIVKTNAGIRLTLDNTLGGFFNPAPAAGDLLMVGGYASYWTAPWLTAQSSRTKRWQSVTSEFENWGSDVNFDMTVHRAGRVLAAGRRRLPASQRDRGTAMLGATGEVLEVKLGTTGPAQPWKLRTMTVTADVGGGIR